ncbi:YugN family protein [Gracilibacillus salinarum]|uniref:YugN-like family protein n=1 Tax=Gracilibacillus salinarum TaxID=2932255 RepID=A0ABY4GM84_9BACI|nr:YugN family protein [Gracilibacillus salinarum]UOQ85344.1 YugN-like family protein [Gracilibacillus salinarum]
MYELDSTIKGKDYYYKQVKTILENEGYTLGGAWDYDHGFFDYKLANDGGYHFLRIPFHSIHGEIDNDNAVIRMDNPYILSHRYKDDIDASAKSGVMQASINQFQTPKEKDAATPSAYIEQGKVMLQNAEVLLAQINNE